MPYQVGKSDKGVVEISVNDKNYVPQEISRNQFYRTSRKPQKII